MNAQELFTRTLAASMMRWRPIFSFRRVAEAGLAHAPDKLYREGFRDIAMLDTAGVLDGLFLNPDGTTEGAKEKCFEMVGGYAGWAEKMVTCQMADHEFAVDAASLVFSHTILDGLVHDYCRVTALVSPEAWEFAVEKRKVELRGMKGKTYEAVLRAKVDARIDALERESLLTKLDRLLGVCDAPRGLSNSGKYEYDRSRIERLDGLRHDVVHGRKVAKALPKGEDDICYMQSTSMSLAVLVGPRFGLVCDAKYLNAVAADMCGGQYGG